MPTIYSSFYSNFIRQGSTFAKSVSTHGYAQSVVVAGTHLNSQNRPVFVRRNNGGFSRLQALLLQSAFHSASTAALGRSSEHRLERASLHGHGGLDAYFEALQKQQATDGSDPAKDLVPFQFPKRIEWKPSPASILLGDAKPRAADDPDPDDGEPALFSPEDKAAPAQVDEALEREVDARSRVASDIDGLESTVAPRTPSESSVPSRVPTPAPAPPPRSAGSPTSSAPPADARSQAYADQLRSLSETGRYVEIPATFEAMLAAGVPPLAGAYNALLVAAIHLPPKRIEVVSKALDVYADMLRRRVQPDRDTFNVLVGLLASRSLEVSYMKQALEEKRVRFGGMEEPGKFMFASHELEYAILSEDDRLDLALKLFDTSVASGAFAYSSETYYRLIAACARAGRISDMLRLYEHLESYQATPLASVFPSMITAYANSGDLVSAVECYNEYKELAIANDDGEATLIERQDVQVYAAVIDAYVTRDKTQGAVTFYQKVVEGYGAGTGAAEIKDALIEGGFVEGLSRRGTYHEALRWAQTVEEAEARVRTIGYVVTMAADHGDGAVAAAAFSRVPPSEYRSPLPAAALLALSVRRGDVSMATRYWRHLSSPEAPVDASLIEPTAMYAVALIGSGKTAEGLAQSDAMFGRIRSSLARAGAGDEEVDEGVEFVSRYMRERGIADPRWSPSSPAPSFRPQTSAGNGSPYPSTTTTTPTMPSSFDDAFDPYAASTDFKGSSLISEDLEGPGARRGPRLQEALSRFRNIRRSGRHPRYITYAKLISAAAKEGKMSLCDDVLAMARTDVPLLAQHAAVRYGWSSILDAMVFACLTTGNRRLAEQYHQELLDMGAAPSANTYGLYITTLKESTHTFDEATEAVSVFHRAKSEGVEPTSFLYNALIGKLGKARRIDDCLYYFAEMRGLGIRPTSVTYGTVVNALCRVSDEKFAEELFDEMEAMPNYKSRPAPYNCMMQFFLTTKRDKPRVLAYYERMKSKGISPTSHTYKLLIDTHATLDPINMAEAETVIDEMRAAGQRPDPVHYASLIYARGCVLHDMDGARKIFDSVSRDPSVAVNANIFQALLEAMVANHRVAETEPIMKMMERTGVGLTPYIANGLIRGWASEHQIDKARALYNAVGREHREPSTYDVMTRAYLAVEDRENAKEVVGEMLSRGYPNAVANKVLELLAGGTHASNHLG